tara:strand:- start:33708 stop:34331 length:624 start_codon:yes stop_codon:yes gene_type:complete
MKSCIKRKDFSLKEMSKLKPNPNSKDYFYVSKFEDMNDFSLTIYFGKEKGVELLNASLSWKEAKTKEIFKTDKKSELESKITEILESESYMFNKILGKLNKIKSLELKDKPNAFGESYALFKLEEINKSWNIDADWIVYKLMEGKCFKEELSESQLDGLYDFLSKTKVDVYNLASSDETNMKTLRETLNSFETAEDISSALELVFSR